MSPARAYVGLGSNLEQPERQVRRALDGLGAIRGTRLVAHSRLYRTPPWGETDQPDFVNAVAAIDTILSPQDLLGELQRLEAAAGRARARRWGPRTLDLDLLLHGDAELDLPGLVLPHPQVAQRAFVLVPLAELAPELEIPGQGRVSALLAAVDAAGIEALG